MDKCYKDEEGNIVYSDYVIFDENPNDIIGVYMKECWYKEPYIIYNEILEENKLIHKKLFKGNM